MEITKGSHSDFTRIFDIIQYQKEKYPNPEALNGFASGQWHPLAVQEIQDRVDALSCWFMKNGYAKGEKIILVPIMGSPEWMILDYACQQQGLITVPVHPTSRQEEVEVILFETEARLCITADESLYHKFSSIASAHNSVPLVHH